MSRSAASGRRLSAAVIAVLLAAGAAVVGAAGPAHAAAYRYWSYWHVSASGSSWSFSPIGASGYRPADGSVEGWRFAVSQGTGSAPSPRTSAASAFDAICGSTGAAAGEKRVALVLDYGTAADAPDGESPPAGVVGECISVPTSAYADDVLAQAGVSTRTDGSGFVCGLNGYPARECGAVVQPATPRPSPKATATPKASPSATPRSGSPGGAVATPTASGAGPGERPSPDSTTRGESEPPPGSDAPDASSPTAPDKSSSAEAPDPDASSPAAPSGPAPTDSSAPTASAEDASDDSSGGAAEPSPSLEVTDVSDTRSSGAPWALLVAVLAIAAIGGAAWWRNRGRAGP